jgi:hypothetical protein
VGNMKEPSMNSLPEISWRLILILSSWSSKWWHWVVSSPKFLYFLFLAKCLGHYNFLDLTTLPILAALYKLKLHVISFLIFLIYCTFFCLNIFQSFLFSIIHNFCSFSG